MRRRSTSRGSLDVAKNWPWVPAMGSGCCCFDVTSTNIGSSFFPLSDCPAIIFRPANPAQHRSAPPTASPMISALDRAGSPPSSSTGRGVGTAFGSMTVTVFCEITTFSQPSVSSTAGW
eukprot:1945570-Rhodomonas_salina.1